jgi:hypothetical protein
MSFGSLARMKVATLFDPWVAAAEDNLAGLQPVGENRAAGLDRLLAGFHLFLEDAHRAGGHDALDIAELARNPASSSGGGVFFASAFFLRPVFEDSSAGFFTRGKSSARWHR